MGQPGVLTVLPVRSDEVFPHVMTGLMTGLVKGLARGLMTGLMKVLMTGLMKVLMTGLITPRACWPVWRSGMGVVAAQASR